MFQSLSSFLLLVCFPLCVLHLPSRGVPDKYLTKIYSLTTLAEVSIATAPDDSSLAQFDPVLSFKPIPGYRDNGHWWSGGPGDQ